MAKGKLYVISGPSGSGKTTLIRCLFERVEGLRFAVSYTNRPQRPGERDGVDYCFVQKDEFQKMVDEGRFAEWAEVHGNLYGTPRAELDSALEKGEKLVLDIDVQGAESIKGLYASAVYIFITPPSPEEQVRRLKGREEGVTENLNRRIKSYESEMEKIKTYDYIINNDELERAAQELIEIISAGKDNK